MKSMTMILLAGLNVPVTSQTQPRPDAMAQLTRPAETNRVFFEERGDGTIWAIGQNYKIRFDAEGATYFPCFGPAAAKHTPIRFRLETGSCGVAPLHLDHRAPPLRDGDRITFPRGCIQEIYDLTPNGLEQSFRLEASAGTGELMLRVRAETELAATADTDGIRFENSSGVVRYGEAFLVDADGARTPVTSSLGDRSIELRISASALTGANYPVVIDPLVRTLASTATGYAEIAPDIAYDRTTDRFLVVFELVKTATDHDVFVELHDGSGALVPGSGNYIREQRPTSNWTKPRVANLNWADRFLVVAEVTDVDTPYIAGQLCTATAPAITGAPFVISNVSTMGSLNPDVGGDPVANSGGTFEVVWEQRFASYDVIRHRSVGVAGSLGTEGAFTRSTGSHRRPRISKSRGTSGPFRGHNIVFESEDAATGMVAIYAVRQLEDGSFPSNPIRIVPDSRVAHPAVSSVTDATDGHRYWMVAYEGADAAGSGIMVQLFRDDRPASPLVVSNLTRTLERTTVSGYRSEPSVETDGLRFAVGYVLTTGTAPLLSSRAYISTIHRYPSSGSLGLSERMLSISGANAAGISVTSLRASGGGRTHYAAVWSIRSLDPRVPDDVSGALFDGIGPGPSVRRLAIGNGLPFDSVGEPTLGETVYFAIATQPLGVPFILLGGPSTPQPIDPGALCSPQLASFGVDWGTMVVLSADRLPFTISLDPATLGNEVAFQALDFGPSSGCWRVSDTLILKVR